MNVLLVRPKPPKESIGLQSFMICEPLELEYLAAAAEKEGHTVTIIDMMLERKRLKYFLKKYSPDIVGFTSYITHVHIIHNYSMQVKEFNSKIYTVVGGVHGEVNPGDFCIDSIDFIVKANGIKTFLEILKHLPADAEKIKILVQGVWNGPGKHYSIEPGFDYPFPDRLKTKKYRKNYNYIYHTQCALIKTSFGCAYNCEFCFCIEITDKKYFERDLEDVIREIKTIEEKNIFIVDDNFLYNPKRVLRFCNLLNEHNIEKNFILFGRADFIQNNEAVIKAFKAAGLHAVFVGIESFKKSDLLYYNKRTNVENNVKAIKILEENGVDCYSGIIAGPDWKTEDFLHLVQWLNQFTNPVINLQPLTPMPGTKVFEKYRDKLIIKRNNYAEWDMAHLVLQPANLSFARFYYNIVKTYYSTSAGIKAHYSILRKYGLSVYIRVFLGSLYITMQYVLLIIKNIRKERGRASK